MLTGDAGNDWLDGGDGNDLIYGGEGIDTIFGGAGDDVINIISNVNGNTADGGAGNDVVIGSEAGDILSGGAGHNSLSGEGGADTIHGGDGDDFVFAATVPENLLCLVDKALGLEPCRGSSVQTRDKIGLAALQFGAQQLAEQVAIPVPAT